MRMGDCPSVCSCVFGSVRLGVRGRDDIVWWRYEIEHLFFGCVVRKVDGFRYLRGCKNGSEGG